MTMTSHWTRASLVLAALLTAVKGQSSNPDNVSSKLNVHIPYSLYKEEGYDHREALFGTPPYGGSITQKVYYADSTFCDSNFDKSSGYPQRSDGAAWESPFILMVDRGSCTFVQKVRNAQRAGAAGVVIADDTCLCNDTECTSKNPNPTKPCENVEPIMADDGSGGDVSIPSFLMFKHDADPVKVELKGNKSVQMEMAWSLPRPDDRVEYDLWTTPSDGVALNFISNFKNIALALGKHAYFTPHMYIIDGQKIGCRSSEGANLCYNLCTNNGRYCATDPDNDSDRGISGQDVVKESLRRLCIWSKYGGDGIGKEWWDYVNKFNERCADSKYFTDNACIKDAYKNAKVDGALIDACLTDSGGLEKDGANSKLQDEIDAQSQRGVVVIPTAFVNTAALRGALNPANVFTAICAGYSEGTVPDICHKCASCPDVLGCVNSGGKTCKGAAPVKAGTVSSHTFFTSMFLVIALFTGLGVWHYKRTQDEMRDQVRGILAEYMPLEDQDAGGSPMDFARGGASTSLMS